MNISEFITEYKNKLGCSYKEISGAAGLTPATISRYKSGERVPAKNSAHYFALIKGLSYIAKSRGCDISEKDIVSGLNSIYSEEDDFNFYGFRTNLSLLMDRLHITLKDVADAVGKDISYISRIKAGTRHPADPEKLTTKIATFVSKNYTKRYQLEVLSELLDYRLTELREEQTRYDRLFNWLYSDDENSKKYVDGFVHKLDRFDLNEVLKTFSADKNNKKSDSKLVTGKKQVVSYDLDDAQILQSSLIEKTVKKGKGASLDICWNMSSSKLNKAYISSDVFLKSLSGILEKGTRIRIININSNPMNEMIDWLDNWLPLNMSGLIESYYLDRADSDVFINSMMVSDVAAMTSEGLSDNKDIYRSYLTEDQGEIEYYRRKFEGLIELSQRMIDVIGADNHTERRDFLMKDMETSGKRTNILSTPPIYTISDSLLKKILKRNEISEDDAKRILEYIHNERKRVLSVLKHSQVEDHIPAVSKEEYDKNPVFLSLSGLFYDKDIFYTYEEYIEHLENARKFQEKNSGYSLVIRNDLDYRNIQIFIHEKEWVMISKNKSPAIHFVVRHPVMRQNLEDMLEAIAK